MLPAVFNIEITAGDGYNNTFTFKDSDDKPIDVSTYTFRAQIRKKPSAEEYTDFGIDDTDSAEGKIVISLSGDQVRALGKGGVWDMEYVISDGDPTTIIKGKVKVVPDVTRVVEEV